MKPKVVKKLCRKEIGIEDLTEADFQLEIKQKGVDMRLGLDIASMATKKLVDAIVLIAGDSDFFPAAKHARREGIDFILDPMWHKIKPSLYEHIDGLKTYAKNPDCEISDFNDEFQKCSYPRLHIKNPPRHYQCRSGPKTDYTTNITHPNKECSPTLRLYCTKSV